MAGSKIIELSAMGADDILRLNQWQVGASHPFTCARRNDGNHRCFNGDIGALVATTRGWICPWCDYTQSWAHEFMMEDAT